jgi:hypothetical protein
MKQVFWNHKRLLVCLLTLGITGCMVEYEVEPTQGSGRPIVFSPEVERNTAQSRAATGHPVDGTTIPSGGSFGVHAYSKITPSSNIEPYVSLQNTVVTSDGTDFTYSPLAAWPIQTGAELAFYGYYPWQNQSATPATGDPVIGVTMGGTNSPSMTVAYTTPSDPAKQIDLMWARTALMTGYNPVQMVFGHALTRINFMARKEDYTEAVIITKITVTDVLTEGTLTVPNGTTPPSWSSLSTPVDMELTATNGLLTNVPLTGTLALVTAAGGDMLVIPQGVVGIEVRVEATKNGVAFNAPFVFLVTISPDWEMNTIVTYEITLLPTAEGSVAPQAWHRNAPPVLPERRETWRW